MQTLNVNLINVSTTFVDAGARLGLAGHTATAVACSST